MTKKDLLLMSIKALIGIGLIWYSAYLFLNQIDIAPSKPWNYDATILLITGLIWLIIAGIWILRVCFNKPRLTMILMGIFIILFAYYSWITDYPTNPNPVFLKDILVVLWTLAVIFWMTKICIYDKCKKIEEKKKEEEMEIIEV